MEYIISKPHGVAGCPMRVDVADNDRERPLHHNREEMIQSALDTQRLRDLATWRRSVLHGEHHEVRTIFDLPRDTWLDE